MTRCIFMAPGPASRPIWPRRPAPLRGIGILVLCAGLGLASPAAARIRPAQRPLISQKGKALRRPGRMARLMRSVRRRVLPLMLATSMLASPVAARAQTPQTNAKPKTVTVSVLRNTSKQDFRTALCSKVPKLTPTQIEKLWGELRRYKREKLAPVTQVKTVAKSRPNMLTDLGVVQLVSAAAIFGNPADRQAWVSSSLSDWSRNISSTPVWKDGNSALVNNVGHPAAWASLALYLKARGHSTLAAFAGSMAHNILWEYVWEGKYVVPSGHDLVFNTGGTLVGLGLDELAQHANRRLAAGDDRLLWKIASWANPLDKIPGVGNRTHLLLDPAAKSIGITINLDRVARSR